jgi:TP901 family phage tail tape measure protein
VVAGAGDLGRAVFELSTDDSKLDSGFASAEKKAGLLGGGIRTALAAGAVAGGAAIVAGLGAAVSAAADFEQSLADTAAATGATKEQMALLRQEALGIGADTSKSASEAALAMGELVKAGMSVEQVVGGGARAAVQLAEATGIDVPAAAILMSKSLNTFKADGLSAEQTANLLAKAANASAIGVNDVGMSLAAVGPVAAQAGLSTEDFAAAIGIVGNNALVGSDAGTSLKTMLMSLMAPTDTAKAQLQALGVSVFDAQGNMLPFRDILGQLQTSLQGATEEQKAMALKTIFGSDAIRAANILLGEGVEGWDAFKQSMSDAPSLAEQSATRTNTLNGQIEKLTGSLETIAIGIGSLLLPALTLLVKGIAEVVEAIASGVGDAIGIFKDFIATGEDSSSALGRAFTIIVEALQPVIDTLQSFADDILPEVQAVIDEFAPHVQAIFEKLAAFFERHAADLERIFKGVWDVIGGVIKVALELIKGLILVFLNVLQGDWEGAWNAITDMVAGVWAGIEQILRGALGIIQGVLGLAFGDMVAQSAREWQAISTGVSTAWGNITTAVSTGVNDAVAVVSGLPGAILGAIGNLGDLLWQSGANLIQGLINGVTSKIGELRNTLAGITNIIPDWKGPRVRDERLLQPAGSAIMGGLLAGMVSQERRLKDYLGDWTTAIPQVALDAAMASGAQTMAVASHGSGQVIDYDRLAAAIAANPPRVDLDGRQLMQRLRPHGHAIRQSTGTVFGE